MLRLRLLLLALFPVLAPAATLYVDLLSATPTPPFATPGTAAQTIQEAIDAAVDGDLVLVAPGTYEIGSVVVDGLATRVALTKALRVASQAGAATTIIKGAGPVGATAVRGAYVGPNAVLEGFTIRDGATAATGDVLTQRSGGGVRCDATGQVRACSLINNRASHSGGGVAGGTLFDCALTNNFAGSAGGGVFLAALERCQLIGNTAPTGGGASGSSLSNCLLASNFGTVTGGAAAGSTLTQCTVTANASLAGGAAGLRDCVARNSIVHRNLTAGTPLNWTGGTFDHSCTTPLPPGAGNLDVDPLLQTGNGYRLSLASPCRDAGDLAAAGPSPTDLHGNLRLAGASVDLGAHEVNLTITNAADAGPGSLRQTLGDFAGSSEAPTISFDSALAGQTVLLASSLVLSPPLGLVLDATGLAAPPVLQAVAGQRIFQLTAGQFTVRALRFTGTTGPAPGGGALHQTGGMLTVEDCRFEDHTGISGAAIYQQGGNLAVRRCVFTGNRALAGPSNGGSAIAAVSFGTFSASDCLFQNNSTFATGGVNNAGFGGAVYCGGAGWTLTRCTFADNAADLGGGLACSSAYGPGQVAACTFVGNHAHRLGGAIWNNSVLEILRSTLTGNDAPQGGALLNLAAATTLTHCTVAGNSATFYGGIDSQAGNTGLTLAYSIVSGNTPDDVRHAGNPATLVGANLVLQSSFSVAPTGSGTILALAPGLAPLGNYGGPTATMPLAADSPAREAGVGSPSLADQRGLPIVGQPDLGAYEAGTFSDFSVWIQEKLPAAATPAEHDAGFDFDRDGQTNFEEWLALTDPAHASERFAATCQLLAGAPALSFRSAAGRLYRLQTSDQLQTWTDAPTPPLAGDGNVLTFTLPPPGLAQRFYRVSAALP